MLFRQLSFGVLLFYFTFITKENFNFSLIYSFYCCSVNEGRALKVAQQFSICGLVVYKLVSYRKSKFSYILSVRHYSRGIWTLLYRFWTHVIWTPKLKICIYTSVSVKNINSLSIKSRNIHFKDLNPTSDFSVSRAPGLHW